MTVREWTGGKYDGREGIVVTATPEGITIRAWYDGGIAIEPEPMLTWAELQAMHPSWWPSA